MRSNLNAYPNGFGRKILYRFEYAFKGTTLLPGDAFGVPGGGTG